MNSSRAVSTLLAVCLVFGLGCGSEADVAADEAAALDETDVASLESESDIGAAEQAITMPALEPGGSAQQCAAACSRTSATDLSGQCCVCNGTAKKFARVATSALYLCR
ncbi:MAG TPA: hypothetical protein VJU61_03145 [Polyangiaceae bacterium]|nr:hypothetical protein [Polyangiaceae bacterium]